MADEDKIAIVGMSGRFPGAPDLDAFWDLLVERRVAVERFSEEQLRAAGIPEEVFQDPSFVPARAPLQGATDFDAELYGISAGEAALLDPQHRVFLEACTSAIESAGYTPDGLQGEVGVYGACSMNTYLLWNLAGRELTFNTLAGSHAALANDKDFLTLRVAYHLGLTGPAVTVLGACASGLVAVHTAVNALLAWQCDAALAGAVSITPPLVSGHQHQPGMVYSPDGLCRPFDKRAAGTVSGDGVGVVLLKRLEDALEAGDCIRAVITGIAMNNDGRNKVAFTAPNGKAQAAAIATAHELAGIRGDEIAYLEAHGTGTLMGDPIEVQAASEAFAPAPRQRCGLASVKGNIGHLNAAAGIASFIKTALCLERGVLAPSAGFEEPNPALDLERSPFFVVEQTSPWPSWNQPRRAAVSSFGAGGTNVHVVLEQGPPPRSTPDTGDWVQLGISARSRDAVQRACAALADHLERRPDLSLRDVAHSLQESRQRSPYRAVVAARSLPESISALRDGPFVARADASRVAFVFPAQGSQRAGMARGLTDPAFLDALDRILPLLEPHAPGLRGLLFAAPEDADAQRQLDDQRYAGAATFAVSWSVTQAWSARGVTPDAVLGHSTGEYIAACVAGMLGLEEAVEVFMTRADALRHAIPSSMLLVGLSEEEVVSSLPDEVYLGLVNGPSACVVSGPHEPVERYAAQLTERGVFVRRLRVSAGGHSPMLAPAAERFAVHLAGRRMRAPRVPFLSGVLGEWLDGEQPMSYWQRHLLEPVRFSKAVGALCADAGVAVIEAGTFRSVAGLVALNAPDVSVIPSMSPPGDAAEPERTWQRAQGALWAVGARPMRSPTGARVPLPTTPFDRKRHWIDPPGVSRPTVAAARSRHPRPELSTPYAPPQGRAEVLVEEQAARLLGLAQIGRQDSLIELGADSMMTLRLLHALRRETGQGLAPGAAFAEPTVAGIASALQLPDDDAAARSPGPTPSAPRERVGTEPRVLVPLQTRGDRPALFLLHPAGGVVFPYYELARLLGSDQPVYGLQASGLDGVSPIDRTVEEMAQRYLRAIRQQQPRSPYHLAGFSFGCYLAYEIALQLTAAGEQVAFLGLMDELVPIDGIRPNLVHVTNLLLGQNRHALGQHLRDYLQGKAAGRQGGLRSLMDRFVLGGLAPEHSDWFKEADPGTLRRLTELFVHHSLATFRYRPGPYDGDATVFTSQYWERRPFYVRREPPNLGWHLLVRGEVETRAVRGDHLEIVRRPFVEDLARETRAALDRVL